jgi:hypothetical protein
VVVCFPPGGLTVVFHRWVVVVFLRWVACRLRRKLTKKIAFLFFLF